MKLIAKICPVPQLNGRMARFYSVQFEGNETNEVVDFFYRHEGQPHLREELDEISEWIDGIANQTGALPDFFRHEHKALALPPNNINRNRYYRQRFQITFQQINRLRLYLVRFNECVVFLLNGGEKTNRDPKNCPNVGVYFRQAQQVAEALDKALENQDIKYNPAKTDIIIHPEFQIEIT